MKKRKRLIWTVVPAAGWLAGLAVAAEAPQPVEIEPLVVVGEGATASVLTRADLSLLQARSLADLSGAMPGFNVVTTDSRGYGDVISMRGAANTLFFSPAAVGMVMDDVPMGEVFSYPNSLLELDSARLLRGPQGAAFGRGGPSGMIEMTTPRAGERFDGRLSLEGGSYNSLGARLRTSGPLTDGWAHAFQIYHLERDGFIDDPTLGRAIDDRSLTGGLGNLFWKPDADTEIRLRVFGEYADDGAQRLSPLANADPFKVESGNGGDNQTRRLQVSLHWTREHDWGRFKSITSWQEWKLDPSVTDLDFSALPLLASTIYQDQRIWSQELRWESPADAAPWSWRTGLFFMDQDVGGDATRTIFGFDDRTLFDIDQTTFAAYGRVTYAANDRTDLQAGVRLEYHDTSIDRSKTSPFPFALPSAVRDSVDDWYVSPELGLSQRLADGVDGFFRSAIGVRPAGFSGFVSDPALARYDEEVGWNNELGVEVALPDERLTFGITGFCNLLDDYQLNVADNRSTDYFTVNASAVVAWGIEGQVRWQATEDLSVQAAFGWVDSSFDDFLDPVAGIRRDGNKVPFVPEWTGSLAGRYEFGGGFYAQTALRVNGPTYFDAANADAFRQDAYLVWDAEVGYARGPFSVALFGRNLADKDYYTFINPEVHAGAPGDPQTFGVRAEWAF
ncbi:MAG: TonB-dependent receptor [Akkermansiaceae bacterium]|jgi:iron complex outermembrane receptor protein|nr:TonB-dependent receptor [Akkermansiaceae bacterium]